VSLARLADALATGNPSASMLGGLNRIAGVIAIDRDVILFGTQDGTLPALAAANLAVALKNAWAAPGFEGELGVSIDPDPSAADPWKSHLTSVFGMPPTAPMARLLLHADWLLKRAAAGLAPEVFPGVLGSFERGGPVGDGCNGVMPTASAAQHRFEIVSQKLPQRFAQCAPGMVKILRPMQAVLTVAQKLETGGLGGGREGTAEPAARNFANEVTAALRAPMLNPEYAAVVEVFRELEVAWLLRYLDVPMPVLAEAQIELSGVPERVDGVTREDRHECEPRLVSRTVLDGRVLERYQQRSWERRYRGGVRIGHPSLTVDLVRDFAPDADDCSQLRDRILAARSGTRGFAWKIR
jgi:hypothetical protein